MINQNHQYYKLAMNMYPRICQTLLNTGRINQMEYQFLASKHGGPEFSQFVQNVINQCPCLNGEQQMEQLLFNNFISQLIAYARQNNGMNPGMMMGGGGGFVNPGGGVMWGGGRMNNQMFGGGGMGGGMMGGGGGGSWYSGQRGNQMRGGMFTARPQSPGMMSSQQQRQPKEEPKKDLPKVEIKWAEPTLAPEYNTQQENKNGTSFQIRKFTGSDNVPISEAFVIDGRPIYKNGREAIEAYKNILGDEEQSHKFITICYRELKLIRADRTALVALIKACAVSAQNHSHDDVAGRIRAIMSVSEDHPSGAVNALHKLIVDEFNEHVYSGELTDATAGHLDWKVVANNLGGIYDMLTGNLDKQTRDTLHQIKNFDESLKRILTKVLQTVVVNGAAQKIFDPINDRTIMDVYGRVIPPVWKNEANNTWEVTPNYFTKYLASVKTIVGSKPDSALVADQSLRTALANADKEYCVLQVPRIITWCNYPSSHIVGWGEGGKCIPRVFSAEDIKNDTTFFLNRSISRVQQSKLTEYTGVPCKILCDVDEGSIRIDYGLTTDGGLWCGCLRYKY